MATIVQRSNAAVTAQKMVHDGDFMMSNCRSAQLQLHSPASKKCMTSKFFSSSISAKLKPSVDAMAESRFKCVRISSGQRSRSWRRKLASGGLNCRTKSSERISPLEENVLSHGEIKLAH